MKGSLSKLIEKRFEASFKKKTNEEVPRDYIGASAIGSDCWRQIWYEYKGYKGNSVNGAIRRTWMIGNILENMMINIMKDIGIKFIEPNGSQHALNDNELPYFRGHCDAILAKPKRILELKAVKDASFNVFKNQGFKQWNKKYYDQVQSYMGMSGIEEAYVLMLNKDSSGLHDELVTYNETYYKGLKQKAKMIHQSTIPPPKVNASPAWYQCKMCKYKSICHK